MVNPAPIQQNMPVGFRFRPTEEDLVDHYLRHKLLGDDASIHNIIPEIDVCKYEPCELPAAVSEFSLIKSDDPEWFFFSPIKYKYPNSTKSNRATSDGYWKATGKERKIRDPATNNVIGTKKTLVFYQGRLPGTKTNWVIHEYHHALFPSNQRTHVLCKLLKKTVKKSEEKTDDDQLVSDEIEPHDHIPIEYERLANGYMIPEAHNFSYMADPMMTQTPLGSDDYEGSMTQTPPDLDSAMESEEFDFTSFLRSSPSRDEQE